MFGFQNATITKIYDADAQSKSVYGQVSLDTSSTVSYRVWLEEGSSEQRTAGGDTFQKSAKVYTDFIAAIKEGDIITIAPDTTGKATRNWRITNIEDYESTIVNRSEYNLVLEA